LGDDADLFASNDTQTARVEDGDDDLLGGDFSGAPARTDVDTEELDGFESSFPAIETQNAVRHPLSLRPFIC